jgi:hypothetical protein
MCSYSGRGCVVLGKDVCVYVYYIVDGIIRLRRRLQLT